MYNPSQVMMMKYWKDYGKDQNAFGQNVYKCYREKLRVNIVSSCMF